MKKNERFGVAIHILSYLDTYGKGKLSTSSAIAESIDTNPVVVRRILRHLNKAGFVSIVRGAGGTKLKVDSSQITLDVIYKMFADDIYHLHPNPNEQCPLGRVMNQSINDVLKPAVETFHDALKEITIKNIVEKIEQDNKGEWLLCL